MGPSNFKALLKSLSKLRSAIVGEHYLQKSISKYKHANTSLHYQKITSSFIIGTTATRPHPPPSYGLIQDYRHLKLDQVVVCLSHPHHKFEAPTDGARAVPPTPGAVALEEGGPSERYCSCRSWGRGGGCVPEIGTFNKFIDLQINIWPHLYY